MIRRSHLHFVSKVIVNEAFGNGDDVFTSFDNIVESDNDVRVVIFTVDGEGELSADYFAFNFFVSCSVNDLDVSDAIFANKTRLGE